MQLNLIKINGKKRQVLIAACMYLGQLVIGYSVSWSGVMLSKLRDRDQSPLSELLTGTQLSLAASIFYVGTIPGPYLAGWLSNIRGRKPCLFFGGLLSAISYLLLALSTNLAMVLCARILCGFGTSIIAVMNLVYIGEIASTNIRGILLTVMGIFHTTGGIILYSTSYFASYPGTNYVGLACCITFILTTFLIPESPIFYVLEGKDDAVIKILHELGRSEDIHTLLAARKEFNDTTAKKDWMDLFTLKGNRKALSIVIIMNVFQHCSGVIVVLFFAGSIFEMAGSSIESNISMLIISAFQITGSFIGPLMVERSGRKLLLIVSSCICSLAMFLLGLYFYLDHIGNQVIDNIRWVPLVVIILFFIGYDFVYIGQSLIGFTLSWTVPILPKLQDPAQSPLSRWLTEAQLSLVATLLYVGCIPGPYIMGWLSNVKGRKPCLFLGGLIASIGYVVLATAKSLAVLYCGRLLSGFGTGILGVMNLVYIGEIASTNIRGILLTVVGITTVGGSMIVLTAGYFLSYAETTFVGAALSLAFTVAVLAIPESPIFYMLKDDDKALRKVLLELGRHDDTDTLLAAKKEFHDLSNKKDWQELFTVRSNSRALFIVVVVNILQHCSGVMAVLFFASIIFDMAGSKIDASLSMLIIAAFQLTGSSISSFLIERAGRKMLLTASCVVCSLSMFLLGLYFYLDHIRNPIVNDVRWLPLVILIFFFIGYEFGLGIIPNVLMGEMFTTNVRSKGSALCMTSSWVVGFLITTAFGALIESIGGHVAFWIFSGTCFCSILFSIFCVVETRGRSLLEIQEILNIK